MLSRNPLHNYNIVVIMMGWTNSIDDTVLFDLH